MNCEAFYLNFFYLQGVVSSEAFYQKLDKWIHLTWFISNLLDLLDFFDIGSLQVLDVSPSEEAISGG